jgi:hypothetical protein
MLYSSVTSEKDLTMARGIEEQAICNFLAERGFTEPSQRVQRAMFEGATPARGSSGKGRGAIVVDIGRVVDTGPILVEQVASIKAGRKSRKTTVTITTGNPKHSEAIVQAAMGGLDIPVIIIHCPGSEVSGKGSSARLSNVEKVEVAVLCIGPLIRAVAGNLPRRTKGQGKGRGNAEPVSWGEKVQTSKAGKSYTYVSIQANLAACGVKYQTVSNLTELADLIEESVEGIYL